MNKWMKWAALAAVVLALAAGVAKAVKTRADQRAAAQQAATDLQTPRIFELSAQDWVRAETATLRQTAAVSGSLRAVHSAVVKARVAGELQGLAVREGDAVRAGQVLARIEPTESQARVQQADQQAQAAAAQVASAKRLFDNNQSLVNQGFISRTALDTSLATLDAAKASHRAALAGVELARKSLADTVLRSPINGLVASRLVQNGERVGVDARLLEVVDLSALELEAAIPTANAANLKVGQTASLQVDGLTEPVSAVVARISPAAQVGSRSVLAYLRLAGAPGLRHGLYAQGTVTVGERTGLALPLASVRHDRPQPYIQAVVLGADGQGRIAHQPIAVLAEGQKAGNSHTAVPFALVNSIANNSILLSDTAGFMQENTLVKLATPATSAPAQPASQTAARP